MKCIIGETCMKSYYKGGIDVFDERTLWNRCKYEPGSCAGLGISSRGRRCQCDAEGGSNSESVTSSFVRHKQFSESVRSKKSPILCYLAPFPRITDLIEIHFVERM